MPRGVKGEKRHPKDVYAKIIPHSAHGGVGGDSAPSVRPWWLWDGGGLIRLQIKTKKSMSLQRNK